MAAKLHTLTMFLRTFGSVAFDYDNGTFFCQIDLDRQYGEERVEGTGSSADVAFNRAEKAAMQVVSQYEEFRGRYG
jgi:hypothetical protein